MAGTILLIGTGAPARERFAQALLAIGCSVALRAVDDAAEAESYVASHGAPSLVLLTEDLIGASSLPLLAALREHIDLDHVPIVVLGDGARTDLHDRGYARLGSAILEPSTSDPSYREAVARLAERFLNDWIVAPQAHSDGFAS